MKNSQDRIPARFDIDRWAGGRVSKHSEHAYDEVLSPYQFDGWSGYLLDEINDMTPPIPELYTRYVAEEDLTKPIPNPTVDAFRLGWASAIEKVKEFITNETKEELKYIEEEINNKMKEENGK